MAGDDKQAALETRVIKADDSFAMAVGRGVDHRIGARSGVGCRWICG